MNGTRTGRTAFSINIKNITIIIVCLILAIWSLLWSWASLTTIRVEKVIIQWEQEKEPFSTEQSYALEARLKRSLVLNSLSANTLLLLGRLYEQQAIHDLNDTKINNIIKAEEYYLLALKEQPSWDYAWAKLARFYSTFYEELNITNKTQAKLLEAIEQTIFSGPYERETQRVIIPVLFKNWGLIENIPRLKQRTSQIFVHATYYRDNRYLTFKSSRKYNKIEILKSFLSDKNHIKTLSNYQKQLEAEKIKKVEKINHGR